MKEYISIDIGGTAIKYGVIDESGTILTRSEMATEAFRGGPAILEKAISIVEHYIEERNIGGVCISTAGMVDTENGMIFYSGPTIPNYTGTRFKQIMEERFRIPCEVENDVNCAGLAECISGAAKGSRITLCLTVGTGIGGCIVFGHEVYHGYSNSACEVGYMQMFGSDFQTLGAASTLARKVTEAKGNRNKGINENILESMDSHISTFIEADKGLNMSADAEELWDGRRIFDAAKSGDVVCCQAIDEMVDILGRGIANICCVLNPQTVVLGGGIMAQEEYLYPRIRAALDRYLQPVISGQTTLKMAEHQNDAGLLGAFYHFKSHHNARRAEV